MVYNQKIFVTGGTGFLGAHFVRAAANKGHRVIAISRGKAATGEGGAGVQWLNKPMDEVSADDIRHCDALVHLASPGVSPKAAEWSDLVYWNVEVLGRLIDCAKEAEVAKIIIIGSCEEYGATGELFDFIPPTAALSPVGEYAVSKAAGYMVATGRARRDNLRLAYLRVFHVYGNGQYAGNLWPSLREAALAGKDYLMTPGEQVRDFVAVEAIAAMILKACETLPLEKGTPYVANLGSGNPCKLRDFAEHWWRKWGSRGDLKVGALPYRSKEVMRYVPLVDKILSS